MSEPYEVRYTAAARDDLLRLFEFVLDRARSVKDIQEAHAAVDAIELALERMGDAPFIYRKAGASPFLRELIVPFRSAGYVALYEIADGGVVNVLSIRHQLEDDYH
ncbi:MAG: type II toxin-antitoxin system RelE/ParE family toxin [Caldimonas sp.]